MYLSEAATADRNFCLGYMMQEAGAFMPKTNLVEILQLYFMMCSIELSCAMMSVVAATLANGGVNPLTGTSCIPVRCMYTRTGMLMATAENTVFRKKLNLAIRMEWRC